MKSAVFAIVAALCLTAGTEDSFLLRNVAIHPVTGPEIAGGMLLVQDGKIAELGAKLTVPKGVKIIEGKGLHVYPGMINAATTVGLSEIGAVRETNDVTELGDFNPQLRSLIAINPESEHIPVTRANGITAVLTMPEGGVISGRAALIRLDGWTWEDMAVRRDAVMHLVFPTIRSGGRGFAAGASRMPYAEARRRYEQQVRSLREFFEQARRYQRAKAQPGPGFRTDLKFEAMIPVLEGKLPMMITASREKAVREALEFAAKEKVKVILAGLREPGSQLDEIKKRGIPVVLPETLALPLEEDDPYDAAFTLPAELHKAGIKFAFGSFDVQFARNIPYQAATAVAFGLPHEEGLKSVTINPAEIFGVSDQIGSIEKGKLADLMVTDGDPLETRTQIRHLFIRGRQVDLANKHQRLYDKYLNRP